MTLVTLPVSGGPGDQQMRNSKENTRQRLLSLQQSADWLGISIWSIRTLIHNGSLPTVRIGRRILIDREDLDRWIEEHKEQLS